MTPVLLSVWPREIVPKCGYTALCCSVVLASSSCTYAKFLSTWPPSYSFIGILVRYEVEWNKVTANIWRSCVSSTSTRNWVSTTLENPGNLLRFKIAPGNPANFLDVNGFCWKFSVMTVKNCRVLEFFFFRDLIGTFSYSLMFP